MKAYRVLPPLRHSVNKRSELSRTYHVARSRERFRFPFGLRQWRGPQPTPIYPVALQLMCSRVEPCPLSPHLPIPISVLLLPPAFSFAPSNPPNSGSRLCRCERMFLSPSLSFPFSCFLRFARSSLFPSLPPSSSVSFSRSRWCCDPRLSLF